MSEYPIDMSGTDHVTDDSMRKETVSTWVICIILLYLQFLIFWWLQGLFQYDSVKWLLQILSCCANKHKRSYTVLVNRIRVHIISTINYCPFIIDFDAHQQRTPSDQWQPPPAHHAFSILATIWMLSLQVQPSAPVIIHPHAAGAAWYFWR